MDDRLDLTLTLDWQSESPAGPVRHRDSYFAAAADLETDALPDTLRKSLKGAAPGVRVEQRLGIADLIGGEAGEMVPAATGRLATRLPNGAMLTPRFGRFYPALLFRDLVPSGGDIAAMRPVRYLGQQDGTTSFDARHPLAGRRLTLSARVERRTAADPARPPVDWTALLLDGPGLQACREGRPTEFVYQGAYARQDEGVDGRFYAAPRMVAHLDARAQAAVGDYYRDFLGADARALDLMGSFTSNLPADAKPARLLGLGMNAAEMNANDLLDGAVVADLNADPALPFADSSFDAVICTASVDYLTRPVEVFREARRVLRPGGAFALSFSNRWFPPKVTRLWAELHPFERIGLVTDYFAEAGGFAGLETWSLRGLPRPPSDRYAGQTPYADPVFAVAARRDG